MGIHVRGNAPGGTMGEEDGEQAAFRGQTARVVSLAWLPEEETLVGIGTLTRSPGRVILSFDS
jgi:hypothetical protein